MATSVTFNGTTYSIPANREPRGWGTSLSSFLVDVAQSSLSKAGGSFTLTADANFGSSYGIVVKYIKSVSSNIAASGVVRLANTDKIAFRNNANGADLSLGVSTGDRLQFESANIPTISSTDTLTNKTIVAANNTITTASSGNLAATELNAALAELQTDIDTRATSSAPTITGGATIRGTLLLQNTSGAQPELQLSEDPDNGTNKVTIKAPATLDSDYTLTLPTDDGTANQVLQTDGSGVLSWATPFTNPMTTAGDTVYGGASGAATRLAGDTSNTKKWLRTLSVGGTAQAPSWAEVDSVLGDVSGTKATGYVGELPGMSQRSGTGGSAYSARSTTTWSTSASVLSVTLNKGIYLISAASAFVQNGTGQNVQASLRIGTTLVSNTYQFGTVANNSEVIVLPTFPVVITSDSTAVQLYMANTTGTVSSANNEMTVIRIA